MKTAPALSPEYLAALDASREASRAFANVTADYRARRIGDAEFLAARKVHADACAAFDRAFDAEVSRAADASGAGCGNPDTRAALPDDTDPQDPRTHSLAHREAHAAANDDVPAMDRAEDLR